jgi:hypothetical protein
LVYRLKENIKEEFIIWYGWSLKNKDCDPAIWLTNYLFDRFEHNLEQKYWIAWIYGTTYHLPTTWIIWNEFPDFDLVDYNRLEQWNNINYKRLRYQTDTKYNKGFLPAYSIKQFRLLDYSNTATINSLRTKKSKDLKPHERFVLNVVGEYGCRDFYILKDLKEYNSGDNLVASDKVIAEDDGDF